MSWKGKKDQKERFEEYERARDKKKRWATVREKKRGASLNELNQENAAMTTSNRVADASWRSGLGS